MTDVPWFLTDGESKSGPFTLDALREELARPGRGLERLVWREGMADWTMPDRVPELAPPPAPPSRPEPREPMFALGTKDPRWFMVGTAKLVAMFFLTFGMYQVYWFYKQWDRVRDAGDNLAPAARSLFSIIFCYSLFRRIIDSTDAVGVRTQVPAWLLAAGFILTNLTWRVEGPASFLGFLAFVPLVAAQRVATAVALAQGSTEDRNTRLTLANCAWIAASLALVVLIAVATALHTGSGRPAP